MAKPKIFVSHSSKDAAFATKLVNDLNAAGADAWMDTNDLGAGNFQDNINQALTNCEWFLLVLTQNALTSDWVKMEVSAAIGMKNRARIRDLIFVKAAYIDYNSLPPLWSIFHIFEGDYDTTLAKTLKAVGLFPGTVKPTSGQPLAPTQLTPSINPTALHGPSESVPQFLRALPPLWGNSLYPRIRVVDQDGRVLQTVGVTKPRMVVGRNPGSDIVLAEEGVSRQHIYISTDGIHVSVTDLGSNNGTFLAGYRLLPQRTVQWDKGDALHVGSYWLLLG